MNLTSLRLLPLAALALTTLHCGGDGSEPLDAADDAVMIQEVFMTDCVAGTMTFCPGATGQADLSLKSCTIRSDRTSVSHPLWAPWGVGLSVPIAPGSYFESYCAGGERTSPSKLVFKSRPYSTDAGFRKQFSGGVWTNVTVPAVTNRQVTYHTNGLIKSYFPTTITTERNAQGGTTRCRAGNLVTLNAASVLVSCTPAPAAATGATTCTEDAECPSDSACIEGLCS